MSTANRCVALCGALLAACCFELWTFASPARGQSQVVFITAHVFAVPPPTTEHRSRLFRFDNGVETFSVDRPECCEFLSGATVLNGNILVADSTYDSIRRFSPEGTLLSDFASLPSARFLESDSNGNVYVNPGFPSNFATRFNAAGDPTQTFTHPTIGYVGGVDADTDGNVYIAGGLGPEWIRTLFKFAPDGTLLNATPLVGINPIDVSIDEAGQRLFLSNESTGTAPGISIYDISGPVPVSMGGILTPDGSSPAGIHFADASGNVLVTDLGGGGGTPRVLEYAPGGALLREYYPANAFLVWDVTTFVVPEPTSAALIIAAATGLALSARAESICGRARPGPFGQ